MTLDNDGGGITMVGHDILAGQVTARIALLIGPEKAVAVFKECLDEAGLDGLKSSQDMLRFSRILTNKGPALQTLAATLTKEICTSIVRQAEQKMATAMGREKAKQLFKECMSEAGLTIIDTPQSLLKFSLILIERGGVAKVIGHSLKIQAVLDGAAK